MGPSTSLQALGACHSAQLSQRCLPFGIAWYLTAFCGIFVAAVAGADIKLAPRKAPLPTAALNRKSRRETRPLDDRVADMVTTPSGSFSRRNCARANSSRDIR